MSRDNTLRVDLSELDINVTLLDDLRFYVGRPENYVPIVFDMCMRYLRITKRKILTEKTNSEDLDRVWEEFDELFNERKFRKIVSGGDLSVRMADYRERVADFYYDIFDLMYSVVCTYVDNLMGSRPIDRMYVDFKCDIVKVIYKDVNNGWDEYMEVEQELIIQVKRINAISKDLISGSTYDY